MSIGGSRYYNDDGQLPDKKGRQWTECDINYSGGFRGAERIVFSNDGLVFYTADHYETFEQLY
jgi:guanyl-specific ribonuclease Sa